MDATDPLFRKYYKNRLLKDKTQAHSAQLRQQQAAAAAATKTDGKTSPAARMVEPKERWTALFNEMEGTALDDSKLTASVLAQDQEYRKRLKALGKTGDQKQLEVQLLQIMGTRDHPLYTLLDNFTVLFRELYSRQAGIMETTKIATATLEKAVENVRTFIERMVTLTLSRYPEIEMPQKRETTRQTVQEALFPQIYTDLFAIYQRKHFYRDAEFMQKLYALQAVTSKDLGVAEYLCLEEIAANAAANAAAKLHAANAQNSPTASPGSTLTRALLGVNVATGQMDSPRTGGGSVSGTNSPTAGAAGGGAGGADASPAVNKLRPKKDWRGDAVRRLVTNNKAPASSKPGSMPRNGAASYMPSVLPGTMVAPGSMSQRTTVVPMGPGIGAGGNANPMTSADLLSRSPARAAAIEHTLLSFSPGKPPKAGSAAKHDGTTSLLNLKLQKERDQQNEKQNAANANANANASAAHKVQSGAVSVSVSETTKKQVGFQTTPMDWGGLALLNKANGVIVNPGSLTDSPEMPVGVDSNGSSLLSAAVPIFSLETVSTANAIGSANGAAGGSGSGAGNGHGNGNGLVLAGSSPLIVAPHPTPIDSVMTARLSYPGATSSSSAPAAAAAAGASAAQPPGGPALAVAGSSSGSAPAPALVLGSASGGGSGVSGSGGGSGTSSPVNIRRLEGLPPPNLGGAHAAVGPAAWSTAPASPSAAAAAGAGAGHGSANGTAANGIAAHTTIVPSAPTGTGAAAFGAAAAAAAAAASASSASAPAAAAAASAAAAAPKPSGLTALLTQAGIASKPTPVDPDATHPYRAAIESLKKLALQKTPREKLQCIVVMSEDICTCVDELYKRLAIARADGSDKLCINADDLLSLFALLLIKSKLSHVISEANFIEDFVGDALKLAMPGYFLATLQAAIELIGKIDRKTFLPTNGPAAGAGAGGGGAAAGNGANGHSRRSSVSSLGGATASASAAAAAATAGGTVTSNGARRTGRRDSDASWETNSISSQQSQNSQLKDILNDFT